MTRSLEWIIGANGVHGVLTHDPEHVKEILVQAGSSNSRAATLVSIAREAGIAVTGAAKHRLDQLAEGRPHQGIVARYAAPGVQSLADLERRLADSLEGTLLLFLDGVEDPSNLGAILRTAECAGVTAVVVPKHRAAALTPVARKAASGAAERLPLVQATNLARAVDAVKSWGVWTYGAEGEASRTIYEMDLRGPVALVMGSEGKGLRPVIRKACDDLVCIPMAGGVGSLNVGAAAAVCLFEAVRQRKD